MPATYVNIASTTLGAQQSTVVFSSIPQTYTDIAIRFSVRSWASGNFSTLTGYLNAIDSTSYTVLRADGSAAYSSRGSDIRFQGGTINAGSSTASTFTNGEIYIPNYTSSSQQKQFSCACFSENNAATANLNTNAILWQSNTAVTSVGLNVNGGGFGFEVGSTFYLYGIKNS